MLISVFFLHVCRCSQIKWPNLFHKQCLCCRGPHGVAKGPLDHLPVGWQCQGAQTIVNMQSELMWPSNPAWVEHLMELLHLIKEGLQYVSLRGLWSPGHPGCLLGASWMPLGCLLRFFRLTFWQWFHHPGYYQRDQLQKKHLEAVGPPFCTEFQCMPCWHSHLCRSAIWWKFDQAP